MASNIVDFLIKLRGDGTNAMTVARQVDRQLGSIERKAAKAGAALRNAFSLSNFNAALMSVPGMQFLTNPYTMAAAAVGAVAKVGMAAEQTAVSFTTLLGSQEASKKMLDDIGKMDAKKVYGLDTMRSAAKTMLNYGVESNKVLGYMSQLGDIAGADKQKLSALTLVFGQVMAAGKLTGSNLLQFTEAGFNPLKELEALTGKSYAELEKQMADGAISAEMVALAMQQATSEGGKFYGATASLSQTTGAKLQDMFSRIQEGALSIWEQIQPIMNDVINVISSIIPPIFSVVSTIVGAIIGVIKWIWKWKDEIGIIAVVLGTFFTFVKIRSVVLFGLAKGITLVTTLKQKWAVVQRYLNIAMASNPIGIVIGLIAALAAGVIYCWNKFAGFRAFLLTCWDVIKGLGQAIANYVTNRINELIGAVGDVGKALKHLFSGEFEAAWNAAKSAGSKFVGTGSTSQLFGDVGATFSNLDHKYNQWYIYETAKDKAKEGGGEGETDLLKLLQGNTITDPELNGGNGEGGGTGGGGGTSGGAGKNKTASDIATGGTRNTSIQLNIGKFFDSINVYMADKADTAELERVILQSMNRALAIATSSDR